MNELKYLHELNDDLNELNDPNLARHEPNLGSDFCTGEDRWWLGETLYNTSGCWEKAEGQATYNVDGHYK